MYQCMQPIKVALMPTKQKPDCSKGTPCGYSCISPKDSCLETLGGDSLALANKLVGILAESDKVSTKMSPDEVDALADKDNYEFLRTADAAKIRARVFSRAQQELGDDYVDDPAVIDAVWQQLDSRTKAKLRTKGKVKADDHWNPDEPSGNGKANDARGKYMLELYIKQNGRDAYTGLPIDLLGSDLEHILPYSIGGKQSERPENMVLLSRAVNQNRGNTDLDKWVERVASDPEATKAKLAKPPKIDQNALDEALAMTARDSWQDEDIDKFGPKFYYVSKALGLKNTYSYKAASGRGASDRPPVSWGKPVVKYMAKALREGDTARAEQVSKANDELLSIMSRAKDSIISKNEAGLLIRKVMSSLKVDNG